MNKNTTEILALTGIRFLAAFSICLAHILPRFFPNIETMPAWCLQLTRLSAEGMTLFFVLSGFVIHYNYSHAIKENPKVGIYNFMIARLARLWPLYLICLGLDFSINWHQYYANLIRALPFYLTLTQSWFYLPIANKALIYQFGPLASISWSVSTEWFFYICYPFICFSLLKMIPLRSRILFATLMSVATITLIAVMSIYRMNINENALSLFGAIADMNIHPRDSFMRWIIYFSPYSRISEFILGCFTAAAYMQISNITPSKYEEMIGFIVCAAAITFTAFLHSFIFNPPSIVWFNWLPALHQCFGFAPAFAILIFCCARYQNIFTQLVSNRFILFGGEISYSIYLLHPAIIGFFFHLLTKFLNNSVFIFFSLVGLIFTVAAISYKIIESPARRWLRNKLMIVTISKQEHSFDHVNHTVYTNSGIKTRL